MVLSLLVPVVVTLAALSLPASAGDDLFMFTDEAGTLHLTNLPDDPRYQPFTDPDEPGAAAPAPGAATPRDPARERHAQSIASAAADTGLPEGLLHAVIQAESRYDAGAVSPKGAVGLMQLMPDTARRFGVADARDPAANVLGGARYLKTLLALFDADLPLALAAYNAGPAAVLRSGRAVPPYAETQRYVPRVLELYRRETGQ